MYAQSHCISKCFERPLPVPDDAQKSFNSGMSDDLLDQLVAQLQTQYDVRIDQAAVAQALAR